MQRRNAPAQIILDHHHPLPSPDRYVNNVFIMGRPAVLVEDRVYKQGYRETCCSFNVVFHGINTGSGVFGRCAVRARRLVGQCVKSSVAILRSDAPRQDSRSVFKRCGRRGRGPAHGGYRCLVLCVRGNRPPLAGYGTVD